MTGRSNSCNRSEHLPATRPFLPASRREKWQRRPYGSKHRTIREKLAGLLLMPNPRPGNVSLPREATEVEECTCAPWPARRHPTSPRYKVARRSILKRYASPPVITRIFWFSATPAFGWLASLVRPSPQTDDLKWGTPQDASLSCYLDFLIFLLLQKSLQIIPMFLRSNGVPQPLTLPAGIFYVILDAVGSWG
jgi:hypothetical protein